MRRSFVKTADSILDVKELRAASHRDIPVVAKIEKHEAVDNLDEIIAVSDGIMRMETWRAKFPGYVPKNRRGLFERPMPGQIGDYGNAPFYGRCTGRPEWKRQT